MSKSRMVALSTVPNRCMSATALWIASKAWLLTLGFVATPHLQKGTRLQFRIKFNLGLLGVQVRKGPKGFQFRRIDVGSVFFGEKD